MSYARGRPPSPAELRARRTTRRLVAAAVTAGVVFVAGAVVFVMAARTNPTLSEENLCRLDAPPVAEVIIILDASDPWNEIQRTVLQQEFGALQREIPRFARVSLFTLTAEATALPSPTVQLCNPGSLEDLKRTTPFGGRGVSIIANPELFETRWRTGFTARLDSIFQAHAGSAGTAWSPIMETIRAAAIEVFGVPSNDPDRPKKLYIFSDMLQHTERYSHYTDADWSRADARALADLAVTGTTALTNTEVHVFLLDRPVVGQRPGNTRSALVEFWDEYFSAQGARLVRVRRVEG